MGGIQGRPPRDVCLASDSSEIGAAPVTAMVLEL